MKYEDDNSLDVTSITMLIDRVRDGCDQSRTKVMARLQPFVTAMAARHADLGLRTKESVSDIVQRSYLKVLEKFDSFQGSSSAEFRGWLKTLVINEVRQVRRKWHRNRRDVARECSLENCGQGESGTSEVNSNPEHDLMLREQIEILKVHLSELNPIQQEIIHLRTKEGLTFPQIGEKLNRPAGSISKIWYRALIRLQRIIAEQEQQSK